MTLVLARQPASLRVRTSHSRPSNTNEHPSQATDTNRNRNRNINMEDRSPEEIHRDAPDLVRGPTTEFVPEPTTEVRRHQELAHRDGFQRREPTGSRK